MDPVVSLAEAGARATAARREREERERAALPHARIGHPVRVTRDGDPVSPILPTPDVAFGWLLRHQPFSTDWAMKYEGYAVESVPMEPLTVGEARDAARVARQLLRHDHLPIGSEAFREWTGGTDETVRLTRENCAACALDGYGADTDGGTVPLSPNYAAWERVYVQARRPIPHRWLPAFVASLNDEVNPSFAAALLRDVATWGVRFVD